MRILPLRLRNLIADAAMLYALPATIALLPWQLGFRLLQRLARIESLYSLAVEPAWQAARQYLPDLDEHEFKSRFRLLRLVDHVDAYLTLWRGRRWRHRHISESGAWPSPAGPCVFLTYHWGAGNWIWPMAREHGVNAYFVMQRPQGRSHGLTRLSHWFAHFRAWSMRRAGSGGVIYTGASATELRTVLGRGDGVVGMLDLPALPEQRAALAPLLDGKVRFPFGLARLAVEEDVPVALFSFGLDVQTGRRNLQIEVLARGLSADEIVQRYVAHLDSLLRAAPEAWHMWREMPAMFVVEPPAAAKVQGIQ